MDDRAGVIFDMDGVLIDSYAAHYASWQAAGRELGFAMTHEQFVASFGRTSRENIAEFWPDLATSDAAIARIDDRKESHFRAILERQFPAMDGAVELIDALAAAGFALAVGSSGPPENVALTLDGLGRRQRFAAVITARDVTRGKPDPQVFLLAAERLGLPPRRCVVIEDAPAGIAAAKAAGMKCIGLASTGRTPPELAAADLVVNSLRDISAEKVRMLLGG